MPSRYDQVVDPHRPNNAHAHALALIGYNRRVLELGAAAGHVTRVLTERRCTVTAIEFEPHAAADLEGVADQVICGDLNDPHVFDALRPEYDIVLAGDVLEHLVRPQDVLCRAVRLLRPGGQAVISLPHVGHVDMRLALLRGEWRYRRYGLLDETHTRFFTLETIKEMLVQAGLTLTELRRVRIPAFESELEVERDGVSAELLDELLADPEAETYQFVFSAAIADGARALDQLAERNAELQDRVERIEIAYEALRVDHAELTAELARHGGPMGPEQLTELEETRRALARVEGSVTWQYFQRARRGVFGALGGETSTGGRALQASLRTVGRALKEARPTPAAPMSVPVSPALPEPVVVRGAPPEPVPVSAAPPEPELVAIHDADIPQTPAPAHALSDTTCVMPWTQLIVRPDGYALFCCDVPDPLTVDGRLGNLATDDLDQLWNAPEIVDTRAAMARGERPERCSVCWKREAKGTVSRRIQMNAGYRAAGGALDVDALPLVGADTGYRLERAPSWFILDLGNTCNLRCRTCSPTYSSRIGGDAVHRAWSAQDTGAEGDGETSAPNGGTAWFRDVERTADMVARGAHENALLTLMGGEPFLIKQTWQLLDALVQRDVAKNIVVGLSTNGQWRSRHLAALAPQFRAFNVSVSIDGHGASYEYLRHGASWERLLGTLDWLTGVDGVGVTVTPTLQNVNALEMVPLFRVFDRYGFRATYNVVTWPARLSPTNLPPNVRRAAAERLEAYLAADCSEFNANVIRGYAELLREPGDAFDEGLFAEFMTFTNDLDASRGERLADVVPELMTLLGDAGITWSDGHAHHAPANGTMNEAAAAV